MTADQLRQMAPNIYPATAIALAAIMDADLPAAGINTLLRRAHFLGQACYESQNFTRFEEDLNYSATRIAEVWPRLAGRAAALAYNPQALGNAAYAGVNGNGNEASGDGWIYRGRGMFQLTGRANYHAACFVTNPDEIATPDGAVKSAIWFWNMRGCNAHADLDDAAGVTRLINGPALEGLAQRQQLTQKAKEIFTDAA